MKKLILFFAVLGVFGFCGVNFTNAQGLAGAGLGEPELKKQFCNSQKNTFECRYLSEGEDCPFTKPTNCL